MENGYEYAALRQFLKLLDDGGKTLNEVYYAIDGELTTRQGEMLRLYYIEQRTMRDIAGILDVNVSTVSRTISRGKKRLLRALKYGRRSLLDAISQDNEQ